MKKILIAADGSKCSQDAARFFSRLPHKDRLEITIVSVINPPHYSYRSYPVESWTDDLLERERESARGAIDRIAELFDGANVSIDRETPQGPVAATILKLAEDGGYDLIVVGAKGHSAVARILLGSTSDDVATHAPCSVLVVRSCGCGGRETTDAKEPSSGFEPVEILIGYEDSPAAEAAIEEFRGTRWGRQSHVTLVSVVPYLYGFFGDIETETQTQRQALGALHRAAEDVRESAGKVETLTIESEHVGEGLVRTVEQRDVDLVVVGETPRGVIGRLLLGSTTRFVLRHVPCSVWITRNRTVGESQDVEATSESSDLSSV